MQNFMLLFMKLFLSLIITFYFNRQMHLHFFLGSMQFHVKELALTCFPLKTDNDYQRPEYSGRVTVNCLGNECHFHNWMWMGPFTKQLGLLEFPKWSQHNFICHFPNSRRSPFVPHFYLCDTRSIKYSEVTAKLQILECKRINKDSWQRKICYRTWFFNFLQ